VPQRTYNELADEIDELMEIAEKYVDLPTGQARNMMHMLYFGLSKLHTELEAGRANRDAVRRSKERRARGEVRGQLMLPGMPSGE
jgi:hypothetical protein